MRRPITPSLNRLLTAAIALLASCAAAVAVSGCGHAAAARTAPPRASLMLDFTPNAIHAGIYLAKQRHYDQRNDLDLQIRVPGQSTDAIDLLATGRVDFAILDIHDLAIADAGRRDLVAIMGLVQRPLASVIAQARFRTPRSLVGQTVGVTGDPSDQAVLRSVLAGAGADPTAVRTITIGYDAVPDLVSGRIAAATAFWNDEGVQLTRHRPGAFRVFRVEDYGAPPYPELVLCTTRSELREHLSLARDLVRTLSAGYRAVLADPAAGVRALTAQVGGLDTASVTAQLHAELPAFRPLGGGEVGALETGVLRRWASWEARFGIVKQPPRLAQLFDRRFLPR